MSAAARAYLSSITRNASNDAATATEIEIRKIRSEWVDRRDGTWSACRGTHLAGSGARMLVPVRFMSRVHAIAPLSPAPSAYRCADPPSWSELGAVVWAGTYTTVDAIAGAADRM